MESIISALAEERQEAAKLVKRYSRELESLPKGSFILRKVGQAHYGYITYSESGQVKQDYLGKLSEAQIDKYRALMKRKKQLKALKKQAEAQQDFLEKSLRHARKQGQRSS